MKIDRRNPKHWALLLLFGLNAGVAWCLRKAWPHPRRRLVVLYGHRLSGNLEAIRRHALQADSPWTFVFLSMDGRYLSELRRAGVAVCHAAAPACAFLLWRAHAVISDHGLHAMSFLPGRTDLRFYDVWHGIPFKGFDAEDFRVQHRYDETWVASPLLRELYITRFGFQPDRVIATGYARTDPLVRGSRHLGDLRSSLPARIPPDHRIILFAPTWKQDAKHRSLWPFGLDGNEFLSCLSRLAELCGATVILRTHLNSGALPKLAFERIVSLPFGDYPDTEALLLLTDLLVCDWSSIAFDYLLLDRPAVFLDVDPPFRKGFSLGPDYRFGPVAASMDALLRNARELMTNAQQWRDQWGAKSRDVLGRIYGGRADGHAAARCLERLALRAPRMAHLPADSSAFGQQS